MQTILLDSSTQSIQRAATLLMQGQLVALPTETVYGLAANAFDADACGKIFAAKGRPSFNPLVVHVSEDSASLDQLHALGVIDQEAMSEAQSMTASRLMKKFWPGPLTIVMSKGPHLAGPVTAGLDTVAVRMPAHPVFQKILKLSGVPLAAPSANRSLRISPSCADDVLDELAGRIPMVIDGGQCRVGLESTIVRLNGDGTVTLLRPGGISCEEVMLTCGQTAETECSQALSSEPVQAPGMLKEHYRPDKPVIKLTPADTLSSFLRGKNWCVSHIHVLILAGEAQVPTALIDEENIEITCSTLSLSGDSSEVASGLYSALRAFDRSQAQLLVVIDPLKTGFLWDAVNDRLQRATVKWLS